MRKAFLEIGALFEATWTGIPNVVAALAEGALNDPDIEWGFVFDTLEVPEAWVREFLTRRSGQGGLGKLEALVWDKASIDPQRAAEAACIFPNIKPVRRFFGREASIIHDLSPLLTPQFHNRDNINHFANRIREDIASSDHLFCVSNATLGDVHAYFGVPKDRLSVIRLGVQFDPVDLTAASLSFRPGLEVEPYIAVLGTLEPRKNGRIVLDYLAEQPHFANRFRTVFVGREGWLDGRQRLMDSLAAAGVSRDRVVFTGYVSEAEKAALLLNAAFCVYPSFFEGFGLPVLEAAAMGVVTVCSNSSSIPEVAPENCFFFNPQEGYEFARAMKFAELRASQTRASAQSLSDLTARAAPYSWKNCYPAVAAWIKEQ
ncbi:glycosyltransferase family 4 protein [Brevundimonas sp.]|uniref:glycosyltransferase family 4 protein n=1 Tax=Brevundimonas sp. TaxID=1871086 RepID=UPI003D103E8E